ncbi:phage integrase N-terminal SAM-like domain-containing protein [Nitrosomonas sp.]
MIATEQSYIAWIKRFIFFHNKQHLDAMGKRKFRLFWRAYRLR